MPEVVLVHGLWYRAWSMWPLARRLEHRGFAAHRFSYPTRRQTLAQNAGALLEFCRTLKVGELHLVGHSLGGLVVLHMLQSEPMLPPGRIVLLGTPLSGSETARRSAALPGGRFLLGSAACVLTRGVAELPRRRPAGMIAGTSAHGLGRVTGGVRGVSDGTISVAETRHAGLAGHVTFAVSHTGMLFSREVADQVADFLSRGHFGRD